MWPPSLDVADRLAYVEALNTTTEHRFIVDVLTLNFNPVESITPVTMDGSVSFNGDADVDRSAQVTFDDPDNRLQIDSASPVNGMVGFDRLVQVTHTMFVPGLTMWVPCPVMTGIPTVPERSGDQVTIELQDQAIRLLPPRAITPYTIRRGTLLVSALRDCAERCGVPRIAFPADRSTKVAKDTAVGGPDETKSPWKVMRRLAKKANYQLWFDAAGTLRLRRHSQVPVVTLTTDDTSTLTDVLRVRTDFTQIRNEVIVTGKKGVRGVETLPAAHPFSAQSLASGGKGCRLVLYYDDPDLGRDSMARAVAKRELGNAQIEAVDVRTSAVPFFHAEPNDAAEYDADTWSQLFRLREATIPFGEGAMSIGYQHRLKVPALNRIR